MAEKLSVVLELVTGQYKREAKEAAAATSLIATTAEKAGLSAGRLNTSMVSTGRTMVGVGAAVVGSFGLAAKAAIDWESAFAGVRKTVAASEPEFAALEQGLLDISAKAPVAAEELAGIAEAAGQLGIQTENILAFTETMAALGVATNLTSDEAATALARFANILQLPQDQFDELGSTIVALGNNLATTEREIVDFAVRIAGAGKQAGLSAASVFAIGAAFSSVGVEAEAGGTAVQKVLLDMTASVASGAGNLETFARVSGLTAAEFVRVWGEDAAKAFTLFVEGLGRAGTDAFVILEELGLTDQRLIRSFLSLAGAGDLLRTSLELGNDAWDENTALTKEAEERYKTVASQLQIFVNTIKILAIEVGKVLLPVLTAAANAGKTFAEFLTSLPEPLRVALIALTGVAGGLTLMGGAALLVVPRVAATAQAVRDLRLAILALRAANLAGAIGSAQVIGRGTGTVRTLSAAGTAGVGLSAAGAAAAFARFANVLGIATTAAWLTAEALQALLGVENQVEAATHIQERAWSARDAQVRSYEAGLKDASKSGSDLKRSTGELVEVHDSWMTGLVNVQAGLGELAPVSSEARLAALALRDANLAAAKSFREDLTEAIAGFVTFFDKAVDEIDLSLKQLEAQFEARRTQNERFWNGLAVLAAAGLDDLVAEIRAQGPEAAGVVEELVADMDRAFEWERRIEETRQQAAAMANALANGLTGEMDTVGAAFNRFGISLARQLEAGFSTADLSNTLTQLMDLADQFGGGTTTPGDRGRQQFAGGGVVQGGRLGDPTLVVAHVGETILPTQSSQALGPMSGSIIALAQSSSTTFNTRYGSPITLVSPVTSNLPLDLQYAALLANHATFGKF